MTPDSRTTFEVAKIISDLVYDLTALGFSKEESMDLTKAALPGLMVNIKPLHRSR